MLNNKKHLNKWNNQQKNRLESSKFFTEKRRNRNNIREYIFNDLKKIEGEWNDDLLSWYEEVKLFKQYRKNWNKAAFDKIIVSNLKFVVYMAKHFYEGLKLQYNCRDIYLDDLVQVGNIWLIKAAQNFVPNWNCKFLSYAQHIIKSYFMNYVKSGNRFFWSNLYYGVPDCKLKQMNNYVKDFIQKNEREPQDEELEEFYEDKHMICDYTTNVRYYRNLIEGILSLDMNIEELSRSDDKMTNKIEWSMGGVFWLAEEETCIKDLLVDIESEKWEPLDRESLIDDLNRVLRKLGARKRKILEMYYGLNWHREHTFKEIADHYNLTHQRIQQEKRTAISIIRDDIQPELLRKYL